MTTPSEPNPPKILIVDDMPANILLLSKMLTARGYHVSSVLSGKLALQAARTEPPDLILLDINMPEMNGYEVCEQLKADAALKDIPVIFISALDQPQEKVKAFRVGGVDYVTKPFQLEELYARVETHLKIRALQRRLSHQNRDLTRMMGEIRDARNYAESIVETVRVPLMVLNSVLKVITANQSYYDTFHVTPQATIGNFVYELGNRQWDIPRLRLLFEKILHQDSVFNGYEVEHDFPHIGRKIIMLNARQIYREDIGAHIILLVMEDITLRKRSEELVLEKQEILQTFNIRLEERVEEEIKKSREKDFMVMRQEKLASLGQLAAGVAHEINNPISFVASNVRELADYFDQMKKYLALQQELIAHTATHEQRRQLAVAAQSLEIPMILDDGASLIAESLNGVERVARIVLDLKSFVRVDTAEYEPTDLAICLEGALTIVYNELKYVAVIVKEYHSLPPILCHPSQLNQVFLNLLINAGHAVTGVPAGRITLKSRHDDGFVYISVADNGHGIPDELKERIFEAFFTTKEIGKGTGLGLSISHDIINKHHGKLLMESIVGVGTTFTVILPRAEGSGFS